MNPFENPNPDLFVYSIIDPNILDWLRYIDSFAPPSMNHIVKPTNLPPEKLSDNIKMEPTPALLGPGF